MKRFLKKTTPIKRLLLLNAVAGGENLTEDTATGNPVAFSTDVAKALTKCEVAFTPVQSGSGNPSPENVRPITGWTGMNVWQAGKNLFDIQHATFKKWKLDSNVFMPVADDNTHIVYSVSGDSVELTTDVKYFGIGFNIEECPFARIVSIPASIGALQFWASYEDGATRIATGSTSCGIPANTSGFVALRYDNIGTVSTTIQIEAGQSATAYKPYSGTSYPVTFPAEAGTVYGGSLDLTTGVLTAEWKAIDMGSVNYSLYTTTASRQTYYLELSGVLYPNDNTKTLDALSSVFKQVSQSGVWSAYSMSCGKVGGQNVVVVSFAPETYADGDAVKAALTGETFCYKLAEPQTYQLTPQQIQTIIGDNTIWSDANGDLTVKFLKKG